MNLGYMIQYLLSQYLEWMIYLKVDSLTGKIIQTLLIMKWGLKQAKNTKNAFFACFRPYVGQPDNHSCPSHHLILMTQGPIPLNFAKKYWELMVLRKGSFFLLNPMKSSQRFLGSKDGSKFWWLPWFPAHEVLGQHLCTGLYTWAQNVCPDWYTPF